MCCFFYYSKEFLRLRVKMKYCIRCELLSEAALWTALRVYLLIEELIADCSEIYFLTFFFNFPELIITLLFIDLIALPLCLAWRPSNENQAPSYTLINSFPEALYFWSPNHYFHSYLEQHYPLLVNYRPLMADILRYDFQIEEALSSSNR